jgi:hypothetical protein
MRTLSPHTHFPLQTPNRKKIEPPASFSELHRISAYVYTFFAAPQILGALLLGTPLNPSLALKYAMVVVATNFGSWLWERGRERYQRALSKKPEN